MTREYETTEENGDGEEVEIVIHYTIVPYIPEQGPSYACGGQPAEGGYAEIEQVLDADGNEFELSPKRREHYEELLYEEAGDE